VTNCTLFDNTAVDGTGCGNVLGSSPAMSSSVLWGTTAVNQVYDDGSGTPVVTYSDVQMADSAATYSGAGNINSDPHFSSITSTVANYLRLSSNSPCIDAAGATATTTDILGNAAYDVPSVGCAAGTTTCSIRDMGAYEYRP
jgi:hypothetical protein